MQDVFLFLIGIVVGGMNAIAGGGMLIGFPALLALGVPAIVANATASVIVLPGQLSAVYGYRRYLAQIPKRYLLLILPLITGSAIGAILLRHVSHDHFDQLVSPLLLAAVVLFAFQPYLHRHAHHHIHGSKKHRARWQPLIILGVSFLPLSVYGGFFGVGFGFVMLAFLGFTQLQEMHRMNAFKNMLMISISATTIVLLASSGLINWHHGIIMACGSFIGGYSGARVAQRIPSHAIRITVIVIGLAAAAYLGLRTY